MAPESEATERKRLARLSRPQWEERSGSNEHRALIRRPGLLLRGGDRRSLSRPIGTRRSRSLSFPSLILIPPFHSCRRRRRIGHGRRSLPLTLLLLLFLARRRAHPRPFSRLPEGAMCSCTYIALSLSVLPLPRVAVATQPSLEQHTRARVVRHRIIKPAHNLPPPPPVVNRCWTVGRSVGRSVR